MSELIKSISDLVGAIPVNSVLRERAAFAMERASALEKEVSELKQKLATAEKRATDLANQLQAFLGRDEFTERDGALFKRNPKGGYHNAVFCLVCKLPMSSLMDATPFRCGKCKTGPNFTGADLDRILRELV